MEESSLLQEGKIQKAKGKMKASILPFAFCILPFQTP
jgi:hypothetical protein